jgi:hypothetical protein
MLPSHGMPLFLIEPSALALKLSKKKVAYRFHFDSNLIESILINRKPILTQKKRTKTWTFFDQTQLKKQHEPFTPLHFDFVYILLQSSSFFQRNEETTDGKLIWKLKWNPKWLLRQDLKCNHHQYHATATTSYLKTPMMKRNPSIDFFIHFDDTDAETETETESETETKFRNRFSLSLSDLADIDEMLKPKKIKQTKNYFL